MPRLTATARTTTTSRLFIRPTPFSINGVASATSGLTIPNNAALNPTAAVTIATWFRFEKKNTAANILFDNSQGGTTNSYYLDYLGDSAGFRWFSVINGVARNITSTTTRVRDSGWHFITATYTGSAIFLYMDGVKLPEEITGISGPLGTNPNQLCLMRNSAASSNQALLGQMCQPMIFSAGCTLAEHQRMYYSGALSASLSASKVLDLAMTEGSGSTTADTSPTGAVATIGAASSWNSSEVPFKPRTLVSVSRTLVT